MRKAVSAAVITLLASSVAYAAPLENYISSAMTAPIRQSDRADDTRRHGAEIAALAEIKPGEQVADFLPRKSETFYRLRIAVWAMLHEFAQHFR